MTVLNKNSWIAVAIADFKITTYRLRGKRKEYFFVLFFLLLTFGYLSRVIVSVALRDVPVIIQPPEQSYPIILLLLFFGFFTPLVSPLGQLASSRSSSVISEPALASPASKEAFFLGRLFSNLAFFSPLYTLGMVAGLTFIPTNPFRDPNIAFIGLTIASFLLSVLSLSLGATVAYLVELSFTSETSKLTRPLVSIIMGLSLLVAIPFTDWTLQHSFYEMPKLFTLIPFVAASKIVIWALYSVGSIDALISLVILIAEISFVWVIGGVIASNKSQNQSVLANNNTRKQHRNSMHYRSGLSEILNAYWKISVRNPEFWTKAVLGISVVMFTLSMFSRPEIFSQEVEITPLAKALVAIFALSFSGLSLLYISMSGVLIERKEFLSVILIAPQGNTRTSLGKLFFSFGIISMFYIPFMAILVITKAIPPQYFFVVYFYVMTILFSESLLMLGIFSINVVHEEEDLMNLVNLVILFVLASFPTTYVITVAIRNDTLNPVTLLATGGMFLLFSLLVWITGISSRARIDLDTSNSTISFLLKKTGSVLVITIFVWMLLPFPIISIGVLVGNEFLIVGSAHITVFLFLLYVFRKKARFSKIKEFLSFKLEQVGFVAIALLVLFMQSGVILLLASNYFEVQFNSILRRATFDFSLPTTIVLVLLLGFVEEFYFREYLYKSMGGEEHPFFYVVVSALLFSSLHLIHFISVINAFFAGLILGFLRIKSSSFNTAFLVHIIYNLGIFIIL